MKYDGTNLSEVLERHVKWFCEQDGTTDEDRADFSNCDLSNLCLNGMVLYGANFENTNVSSTTFSRCDLRKTNFEGANTFHTDFYLAEVRGAKGLYIPLPCPSEGSFIAWKRVYLYDEDNDDIGESAILKMLIPEDAKRLGDNERACWASKAKILEIQDLQGRLLDNKIAVSMRDNSFKYRVGETIEADGFNENRYAIHGHGIYFFIDRQEAVNYWDFKELKQKIRDIIDRESEKEFEKESEG